MSGSQDNWKIFTDTNTSTVPGSEIVVSTAPQNPTGGDSTLFYNIKYRILNSSDLTIDLT